MSTSPLLAYSLQQGSVKSLQYKLLSHSSLWLELHTRSHSSLRDLFYQSSTPVLGWCWGHTSNLARNQLQTLRSQAILPGPCWTLSLMAYNICSLANSLLKILGSFVDLNGLFYILFVKFAFIYSGFISLCSHWYMNDNGNHDFTLIIF